MIEHNDLLSAKIMDCIKYTNNHLTPSFIGFVNESDCFIAVDLVQSNGISSAVFGGYSDAQRVFVCVLPEWADDNYKIDYPFSAIRFDFNKSYSLKHSDFLGVLMSLSLAREKIGDILTFDDYAIVFIHNDLVDFVLNEVHKVGNVGVNAKVVDFEEIDYQPEFSFIEKTVASNRIDCVIGALCNLSREKANQLINSGAVRYKGKEVVNNSFKIDVGVVSIRKYGRFYIDSISEKTKKGRLKLAVRKCL